MAGPAGLGTFVVDTSAEGDPTGIVVEAVSLAGLGSGVVELTVSVAGMDVAVVSGFTVACPVAVKVAPGASVPTTQVRTVPPMEQPGPDTTLPACSGDRSSVRVTPVAFEGPLLVAVSVSWTGVPGVTGPAGEVTVMPAATSAEKTTGVTTVAVLLAGLGSSVEEVTVAELVTAESPETPAGRDAVTVMVAVAPLGIVPSGQVTTPAANVHGPP